MGFEENLQKGIFSGNSERTFIDKVLGRQDVDAIREIIKKPKLEREDLLEILYLLSGAESKLLNYGEYERYVILKFFVWIREFIKARELLYDYRDALEKKSKLCKCGGYIGLKEAKVVCGCDNPQPRFKVSDRFEKLLNNNELLMEHNAKFLIDLYLNIGRTSLSIGATGFLESLKNKYEFSYPTTGTGAVIKPGGGGE